MKAIYKVTVKKWENLPFHNIFCIDNNSDKESSLLEDNLLSILSHNEAWKVFKYKSMRFRHLNVNNLLSRIEELRTLAIHTNISVLGITETKLDNTVSNEELKMDGYNLLIVAGLLPTSKIILLIIGN